MLKEICALRSGSLLAMQHTNEIIKRVLADPTVTSPIAEVVKELSAELAKVGPASALRRCGIVAWIRYDVRALAVWNMNVEAEARIRCWRNIDLCHFCCPSFDNVLA